uniref:Reverse transcriptase domain-containing protein n=1 Tax=Amphiprion ocellaris TaxID=80972 RepID=A0AAQ6A3W9_AMPOC
QKYHQNECKIRETENDEKAFDSIQHKAVFKALKQHGVEDNYINILKEAYDGGTAQSPLNTQSNKTQLPLQTQTNTHLRLDL